MTTLYFCVCVHPLVDVEQPATCRRCLLDVPPFRLDVEGLRITDAAPSTRVDELELEARRQEVLDRLSPMDEAGAVDGRLLVALAAAALLVVAVVVFWQWLVGAGVIYGAYRHLTRGTRRRRPRSSWAQLAQAGGVLLAGWNSRGLVRRNGRPLRVSVPAKAGREHVDQYGEIPF